MLYTLKCTAGQKFGISKIFNVCFFSIEVSYAHQAAIYLIKNTEKNSIVNIIAI